jgi:uncharacterized protein YqgC (DUF456 family)
LTKVYKWIKIGGLLSFIPIAMAAGPLAGYFAADYLKERFNFPGFTSAIFILIGFVASMMETVKIIKLALKTEKEIDGKR